MEVSDDTVGPQDPLRGSEAADDAKKLDEDDSAGPKDPLRGSEAIDNLKKSDENFPRSDPNLNKNPAENVRDSKQNSAENLHNSRQNSVENLRNQKNRKYGGSKRSLKKAGSETRVTVDDIDDRERTRIEEIDSPVEAAFAWRNAPKLVAFELEEYNPEEQDICTKYIDKIHKTTRRVFRKYSPCIKKVVLGILLILYMIYFGFAIYESPSGAVVLIVLTSLVVIYILFKQVWRLWGDKIWDHTCAPIGRMFEKSWWKYCRW